MRIFKISPASLALALAAAIAVPTCDDGAPVVPLADEFAKAFCEHQLSCCSPYELSQLTSNRYATVDECIPFATLSADQQLSTLQGSLAQGRLSVDPTGLEACLKAYRDGACNSTFQSAVQVSPVPDIGIALTYCPDLFVGHVPINQACILNQECVPGSRCVAAGPTQPSNGYPGLPTPVPLAPNPGLCLPYQKVGDRCNTSFDCEPKHSCRTPEFVCGDPTKEGDPCTSVPDPLTGYPTSNCDANQGLFCDDIFTFTCRHVPRANEPCDQFRTPQCDPDPALGLTCNQFSGICKSPGNEGDPCGALAIPPCRANLSCHPTQADGIGVCGVLPAMGEPCSDRCASPYLCTSGVCGIPGSAGLGERCNSDSECASLSCNGFMGNQLVCSASAFQAFCVGADVTPGNVSGLGGTGGFAGSIGSGFGGFMTGRAGAGGASGTAGSAGKGPPPIPGCQISDLPPGDPIIADFNGVDGMVAIPIGGTFSYASPSGNGYPIAEVRGGAFHFVADIPGTDVFQFWGVGIFFNPSFSGTDCVDATHHLGVQFDISGSVLGDGCTVQYSTNDSVHLESVFDPKGSGPAGAFPPQAAITVPATPATFMMPFNGPGAPSGGNPPVPIDRSRLTGVQWQVTTPSGFGGGCTVDITIDNVRFF